MINLVLSRKYTITETQGLYLVLEDYTELFRCFCLELPWLNNQHDISCIPGGMTYPVIKYSYAGHPNCFWIKNVPNRIGIMMHIGDFATGLHNDTHGCQLPGMDFVDIDGNGSLDIVKPDIAMAGLNKYLPDKFNLIIL